MSHAASIATLVVVIVTGVAVMAGLIYCICRRRKKVTSAKKKGFKASQMPKGDETSFGYPHYIPVGKLRSSIGSEEYQKRYVRSSHPSGS